MNIPENYIPILAHLSENLPEVRILAQQVEAGEITQGEAMTKLMSLSSDPRVSDLLRNSVESFLPTISEEAQSELFQPDPTRKAKLNPLYMSAIAERLQFDSDIPELRTGYLAEGTKPQVPVSTDAMSSVALGMRFDRSSYLRIGNGVIIHPGTVIGSDGFGYDVQKDGHHHVIIHVVNNPIVEHAKSMYGSKSLVCNFVAGLFSGHGELELGIKNPKLKENKV